MPRKFSILAAAAFLLIGTVAAFASDPVSPAQIRESIERSLPAIEADAVNWMQNRNCISCHNVSFLLWSHNFAKSRGIQIDQAKLGQWSKWTAQQSLERRGPFEFTSAGLEMLGKDGVPKDSLGQWRALVGKVFRTQGELMSALTPSERQRSHAAAILKRTWPSSRPATTDGGGLDTMAQLLLAQPDRGMHDGGSSSLWDELLATTPAMIVAWQEENGQWKAAGQLPRQDRPVAESDAVATRWAIIALAGSGQSESPEIAVAIDRALEWLKTSNAPRSNESLVTALLVAHRLGAKAGDEKALLAELLKHQNADGGWAWLIDGASSDAFATGQALYALASVGRDASNTTPIARGQRYLLLTQQSDGLWPVTGVGITAAKSTPARLKKVEPIYRQWGSAWAVIGLASTLPRAAGDGSGE